MMDTNIEVGQENIYFEMESKQEANTETYDDVVFRKDTSEAKPNMETQPYKDSDAVKHNPLFFIASASLLLRSNSPCYFGFSCANHDGTERGFKRYGCHCSFLL